MAIDLSALDSVIVRPAFVAPTAPLAEFEEDPENPRFEFDDPEFEDFVEDVRERGILQPVIVRPVDGGKLRIRFGARRYRAAVRLQLDELPYHITEDERQFDDYAQISENERRKSLQPLELAMFASRKLAGGEKKKDIAAKLKITPSTVTYLLSLIDAPPFLLELYHSRKCRLPQYFYELRKFYDRDVEIVERICSEAEVIDRRLLVVIAEEIEPTARPLAAGLSSEKIILDNPGTGGSSGNGGGEHNSKVKREDVDAVKVQQVPAHNPAIEKESSGKHSDPNKIKSPLLLGTYQGREIMIILTQRPSTVDTILIRFEDGSGMEEVTIGDVSLTMLSDSKPTNPPAPFSGIT